MGRAFMEETSPSIWTRSIDGFWTSCSAKAPCRLPRSRRGRTVHDHLLAPHPGPRTVGVIKGRVALLDRAALGLDVTIFAHVKLSSQGRDSIAAFAEAIRERPEVLDCYTTMGEWDFMLRVVTRDIKAYEAFYLDHLSKLPNVQSINSSVTVTVIKETTILPIAL